VPLFSGRNSAVNNNPLRFHDSLRVSLMPPSRSMPSLATFRTATATLAREAAQCSLHLSDTGKSPAGSHSHKEHNRAREEQAATLRRFRLGNAARCSLLFRM
jgi:hypothetical protein